MAESRKGGGTIENALGKLSLLPKYLASAPEWLERLLSLLASDAAGEGRVSEINAAAENEANHGAPALSSMAHAISSPRELNEEVNEYEPKIDQSGRVSFSPDPTGQTYPQNHVGKSCARIV